MKKSARKEGRFCCGGRCMTVNESDDKMFLDDTHFKDFSCMVNYFFLHIEEDTDSVFHHQTCQAKFDGTRGPIFKLSEADKYLDWLDEKVSTNTLPTIKCPNVTCGCGVCVPKARDDETFDRIKAMYIND